MTPIQFNPAQMMNLADMYRQQQAQMEQSRQAQQSAVNLGGIDALQQTGSVSGVNAPTGPFGQMLTEFVGEVNAKQAHSTQMVTGLLSGEDIPLHRAVIAMEEAGVAFQMMVEVRNRLLEGYQELMRMQA